MKRITQSKLHNSLAVLFLIFTLLISSAFTVLAAETGYEHLSLYVKNGSQNGDGSIHNPFGSIVEARDYIRTLKKTGNFPKNGVTVNFREGVYEVMDTVHMGVEDAGTEEGTVTYRAYMDEEVSFVGGLSIPFNQFKQAPIEITDRLTGLAKSAVVQYDLYSNGINREMIGEQELFGAFANFIVQHSERYDKEFTINPSAKLFFEGSEMTIARWPNEGYAEIGEVVDQGPLTAYWSDKPNGVDQWIPFEDRVTPIKGFTFKIPSTKAELWKNAPDGHIYGFFKVNWYDGSTGIASVDTAQSTLTTERDSPYGVAAGQQYYAFNILEEIDMPGEYYIDREKGILYFYPPAASGSCSLSILNGPFIQLTNGADNIHIKNISFECSRNVGIHVQGCKNVALEGCCVSNTSLSGVMFENVYNSHITGCYIHNVGEHAISISGGNRTTLEPSGNFVENNWCHNWGEKTAAYSGAVKASGVAIRVSNNKFNNAPHLAVNLNGNDNLIEYNDISNVLQNAADSGAIYTGRSWIQRGLVIKNNYFHDLKTSQSGEIYGIYLDDFYCGATVEQNIFENIHGGSDTAGFNGGGRDTTVVNNIFIDTQAATSNLLTGPKNKVNGTWDSYMTDRNGWWERTNGYGLWNEEFSEEVYSKYPNIMDFSDDPERNMTWKYSIYDNNVAWNCENDRIWRSASYDAAGKVKDADLVEYSEATYVDSYMTKSDPGFTDYHSGDYTIRENSPIYDVFEDFKAPDAQNIGLYTLRLKNKLEGSIAMKVNSPLTFVDFKYSMIDEENENIFPIISQNRALVPIRYIAEALGGDAQWDGENSVATITVDGKILTINSQTGEMIVDGTALESDVPPKNIDGRFMVPLRVISEKFGKNVEWHDGGIILISDKEAIFNEENYSESLMLGELVRKLSY